MWMRLMCLAVLLCSSLLTLPVSGQQTRIGTLEEHTVSSEPASASTSAASLVPAAQPVPADAKTPASPAAEVPAGPPPQTDATPTWSIGPIDFSGSVDGFYSWNNNHPENRINGLFPFVVDTNQFSLNYAEVALEHMPDPVGFRLDFGIGKAAEVFNSLDNDGGFNQYLQQAYLSWAPENGNGFQVDFGKFVTSAGAELIESYDNWNYTRSILFAWAIPFYHFGLRASIPIGSHFTGGLQLVNGWNNVVENNSGKTVGVTGAVSYDKFGWAVNYYTGPENTDTNTGLRHLIDTTLTLTPSSMVTAYINYDYGQNRNADGSLAHWQGVAGAIRLQPPASKWSFTPRGEWFDDRSGFSTGVVQQLREFTITAEYKLVEGLMWRGEYRHDRSSAPYFDRGAFPSSHRAQDTVTFALIGFFGPIR